MTAGKLSKRDQGQRLVNRVCDLDAPDPSDPSKPNDGELSSSQRVLIYACSILPSTVGEPSWRDVNVALRVSRRSLALLRPQAISRIRVNPAVPSRLHGIARSSARIAGIAGIAAMPGSVRAGGARFHEIKLFNGGGNVM